MAQIFCTYCEKPPVRAYKICVDCDTPLCVKHLTAHNKRLNHELIDPHTSLDEWKCSEHKEVMKYYCTSDMIAMCRSCKNDEHSGHSVDRLSHYADRAKESLRHYINKLKEKKRSKERLINSWKIREKTHKEKVTTIKQIVTTEIRNIEQQLQTIKHNVHDEIERMNNDVLESFTEETCKLEEQNAELNNRIGPIEALCTLNNFTFLRRVNEADLSNIDNDTDNEIQSEMFDDLMISEMLHKELLHLSDGVNKRMLRDLFPKMRKSEIILDRNTAYYKICITDDLKRAYYTENRQARGAGPERFRTPHVLSECSFSMGNHYWEVEVKGTQCSIGVIYDNIDKKSAKHVSRIGHNGESWALSVEDNLSVWHCNMGAKIHTDSPVRSFGIFLEYEAGRLSFYQLCEPIRHLHTFTNTFTATFYEPLHAAFYLGNDSEIAIID